MIRAKREKPPAIRKARGKLWQLPFHLKCLGHGDIEIDWRNCSIWINVCEVVKWQNVNTNSSPLNDLCVITWNVAGLGVAPLSLFFYFS